MNNLYPGHGQTDGRSSKPSSERSFTTDAQPEYRTADWRTAFFFIQISRRGCGGGVRPNFGAGYSLSAASVITWVQAPSGSAEITGSEPPESSVSTVR